jgi:hypothetical protein
MLNHGSDDFDRLPIGTHGGIDGIERMKFEHILPSLIYSRSSVLFECRLTRGIGRYDIVTRVLLGGWVNDDYVSWQKIWGHAIAPNA